MSIQGIAPLVVAACLWSCRSPRAPDPCQVAFEGRDWPTAATRCEGGRRLWSLYYLGDHDAVARDGAALLDGAAGADARYLLGRLAAAEDSDDAPGLLVGAVVRYAIAGDGNGASTSAADLSRTAVGRGQYQLAIDAARLAVAHARDGRHRHFALLALADALDRAGRGADALAAILAAERAPGLSPNQQAWAYGQHAQMLLDRRADADTRTALDFLDEAEARLRAGPADPTLAISLALNRAVGHAVQGDDAAAAAALDAALALDPAADHEIYGYVRGVLAAHRREPAAAEALLAAAVADGIGADFAIDAGVELAAIQRADHRDAEAERTLRAAIAVVDRLRAGGDVELRPWITAHRTAPHRALLALYADAGRDADALAVIESLHARAWLEGPTGAVAAAPSAATLLALAGDRELLVLVELAPAVWRAHLRDGAVTVDEVPAALAAIDALAAAPDDRAAAARAGALLIPPAIVASDRPLYVIATGPRLAALPIAALRRGDRALVDERVLARMPGVAAMQCRGDRAAPYRAPVVIGDAARDLPSAAAEARAIAATLGVPAQLGAAATVAAVIAARDASTLYLAVHATTRGDGAALVLRDGTLDGAAIRAQQLAPRTVVLAGCHTGTSADAEAFGALPTAFLAAGARFVIATTRSIDDDDAARFARAYDAQPDGDAIHRVAGAQRALAAAGAPPSTWASFAAWGELCDRRSAGI